MITPNVPDGYQSFLGGCNESFHPALIQDNQTRRNVNVTLASGAIAPRFPYKELELEFLSKKQAELSPVKSAITYRRNFRNGRIQHVGKFQTPIGEFLLLVINGIIYAVDISDRLIHIIPLNEQNDHVADFYANRINGHQAGDYYVLYDWPNQPIYITSDLIAKRTKLSNQEIPKSFVGTFVHNRTFIANKGVEIGASDPRRPDNPTAVIEFKESIVGPGNSNPSFADQFFSLTYVARLSNITAMGYLKQTDGTSAIGYGPLFVSTKESIHLFAVNQPRSQWEQSEQFGSAYIFNYGIVGQRAYANVGADLIYRAFDSMIYSTARLYSDQRGWGLTNISQELSHSFDTVNTHLLPYAYVTYHKNRVYCGLKPFLVKAETLFGVSFSDIVFDGVGVLEFNPISGTSSSQTNPIWAGVNEGMFVDAVEVDHSLVYVGKRAPVGEENVIYIQEEQHGKDYYANASFPIRSRVYTREFKWPEHLIKEKNLKYLQLVFSKVVGKVSVKVYIREQPNSWELFGYTVIDEHAEKPEFNPFIHRLEEANTSGTRVQLRFDISGIDYELASVVLFADAEDFTAAEHEFDVTDLLDFNQHEDLALWHKDV